MFWISKNQRFWGWMDRNPRGHRVLELSLYSRVRLARENNDRLRKDIEPYLTKE